MRFRLDDVELTPDVFAAVMATGIVSVSADDHHHRPISDVLAGVGVVSLVVMVAMVVVKWIVQRGFPFDLSDPDVTIRLFTFVAACAVLGARFQAHRAVIWVFALLAWLAWIMLTPLAIRGMWAYRWARLRDRAHGAWELASVATSGLAIVTAHLALLARDRALFVAGVAVWVLAIGVYVLMTLLILWRAVIAPGGAMSRPDSWILMGGLAIATLAGDHLHRVASAVLAQDWVLGAVRLATVLTWVAATLWIPPLIYLTVRHLRLRFTGVWWAMVFPLGMYSAATYAEALETRWQPFLTVSQVFFWIAFAAWLVVALAAVAATRRVRIR